MNIRHHVYLLGIVCRCVIVISMFLNVQGCGETTLRDDCASCPERCLQGLGDERSRCVACLTDEQCRSSDRPTRICTQEFQCICNSAQDCPSGKQCAGENGCVDCIVDKDCQNPSTPFCIENFCQGCRPGDSRQCVIDDDTGCAKGTQTCGNDGRWNVCDVPNKKPCGSGQFCRDGKCACDPGLSACSDGCYALQTDPKHCGACGNVCPQGTFCAAGACVSQCPVQTPTTCGQSCVDTNTNAHHCGACGKTCKPGQRCNGGSCTCPTGQRLCDERCIDPMNHNKHCGRCFKSCGDGKVCATGACLSTCPPSTSTLCYGGCVDTMNNEEHCGSCGNACLEGQVCREGRCTCPTGQQKCGAGCVDIESNREHCGSCGKACKDGQSCAGGFCVASCPKPTPDVCLGGCFDTMSSPMHCGSCGNRCKTLMQCTQGTCKCPSNSTLCDGSCVDTQQHRLHCGACHTPCADGKRCAAGKCVDNCPTTNPTACYGGCVDLQTDNFHCGRCGNRCTGQTQCVQGTCQCPSGTTLCGGVCVDTKQTSAHCGQCNNQCAQGQSCQNGVCVCPSGLEVCEGLCVDTKSSSNHCGRCDHACATGESCLDGLCQSQGCQNGATQNCPPQGCSKGTNGTITCTGVCKYGTQTCQNGTWGACVGAVAPSKEVCDSKDNDCDGQIDEDGVCMCGASNPIRACYTGPAGTRGVGECKDGVEACDLGKWSGVCTSETRPQAELCDGKDNDCDGQTDEGLSNCATSSGWTVSTVFGDAKCHWDAQQGKWIDCFRDGPAAQAQFYLPRGIVIDSKGNFFVSTADHKIRKISYVTNATCETTSNYTGYCVTTFAGSTIGFANGQGTSAKFKHPHGLAIDKQDNLYVADTHNNCIRKIDPQGNVTTFASDRKCRYDSATKTYIDCFKDGPRLQAQFYRPESLTFDPSGNLFVSDTMNSRIRKINTSGVVITYLGDGQCTIDRSTNKYINCIAHYTPKQS